MLKVGLEGSGITTAGEPGDYPTSSTPAPSFSRQTGTQADTKVMLQEVIEGPGVTPTFPIHAQAVRDDTPNWTDDRGPARSAEQHERDGGQATRPTNSPATLLRWSWTVRAK